MASIRSLQLWIDVQVTDNVPADYLHSTLRERIVEHVFIAKALQCLWQQGVRDVEVLRSEFDAGGYDLVMSVGDTVRYIQLKSTTVNGKASSVIISLKLMSKPGGCVLWLLVDEKLEPQAYRWFGGPPGQSLQDVSGLKVARHTKANAEGIKAERQGHRVLPKSRFERLDTVDGVLLRLFGP